MAIREGRWDCKQCGTIGIRGRDKICPNCGHPRPEKVRFYLPEDSPVVEDQALLEDAKVGPDWICEYCGASNRANRNNCKQCYAPRGESRSQEVKQYEIHAVPRSGDEAPAPDEPILLPPADNKEEKSSSDKSRWFGIGRWALLIELLLLCLFATWFLFLRTSDVNATVTGFDWERTIQVEELRTLIENDWEIPQGGRYISQKEEIHHYDQVFVRNETRTREVSEQVQVGTRTYVCGQKDLGNGFFEDVKCDEPVYETKTRTETYQEPIYRDVPVYKTKYSYEIDRWVDGRLERETGTTQKPEWPVIYFTELEREGKRSEKYVVEFTDSDDETYQIEMEFERWKSFSLGEQHTIQIDSFGHAELKE